MEEIKSITFHFTTKKERESDRNLSIFLSTGENFDRNVSTGFL